MHRVLLTGASGLLGGRLAVLLAREFDLWAGRHQALPPEGLAALDLDLRCPDSLAAALEAVRPHAVVHSAALADANRCEEEPNEAEALNVGATATLAKACARHGLRLVVVSTDLVFSGERGLLTEAEPAHPRLVYGRTKLAAEEEALRSCKGSAIVRVSLIHGRGHGPRPTASESVAWALRSSRPVRLFTDQYRTPLDPEAVAPALASLLRGGGEGRYHLGGPERLSRHALGLRVAEVLGLPRQHIEAVTQSSFSIGVPRPADVSLDSSRARHELDFSPRSLEASIRDGRVEPPGL
jgi:dTDP-4-dehydrorhamnose reductase